MAGEGSAEDRVGLRRREEVASAAWPGVLDPVVAVIRLVQGELHETGKGHRPVPLDLRGDPLDQDRVALDGIEIRRGDAPQARRDVHEPILARPADRQPEAGPDERVTAENDGDRRVGG